MYNIEPKNYFYMVDLVTREIRIIKVDEVPPMFESVKLSGTLVFPDVEGRSEAEKDVKRFEDVEITGDTLSNRLRL